jgi:hypothetical protein
VAGRGGATPAAAVADTIGPVQVRRANLMTVMTALDAAGVPYFRVPGTPAPRTALAVAVEHRTRALAALARTDAVVRGRDATGQRSAPLRRATIAEVFRPVTDAGRTMMLADAFACDVEFWTERDDHLVSPRRPHLTPAVRRDSPVAHAAERHFGQFCPATDDGLRFPTRTELLVAGVHWVDFPIDAVYTWVDGSDPRWQRRKAAALAANGWAADNDEAANNARYSSRDELRYSMRSLSYYAPWIRRIFLVTDAQVPPWLDVDHPAVTVVDHREIFGDVGRLPTFNSRAIESRLHHIPGLAEHFVYLNDDVFFGRPVTPDKFFLPSGLAKFFPSSAPVGIGTPRPDESPVVAAGMNNRDVLAQRFGRRLTNKCRHTPHPQRRSVLAEIEEQCRERLLATADHQFRHPGDLSVSSSLQHFWSYLTGRAVPAGLDYLYTDLVDPQTPLRLMTLLRHADQDVFCLNDVRSTDGDQRDHGDLLAAFLPAYFPFRAPFERRRDRPVAPRAGNGRAPLAGAAARTTAGPPAGSAPPAGAPDGSVEAGRSRQLVAAPRRFRIAGRRLARRLTVPTRRSNP